MKNFGEKLKLAELRMATIKDKIEIFGSQVSSFMEQPEVTEEESKVAETAAEVAIYECQDQDDPIDVLLAAKMTQ